MNDDTYPMTEAEFAVMTIAKLDSLTDFKRGFYWGCKKEVWPAYLTDDGGGYCRGYSAGVEASMTGAFG